MRRSLRKGTAKHHSDTAISRAPIMITEAEAARALSVSVAYLRKLRSSRSIPYIQIGRLVRYELDALLLWAREHSVSQSTGDVRGLFVPFTSRANQSAGSTMEGKAK